MYLPIHVHVLISTLNPYHKLPTYLQTPLRCGVAGLFCTSLTRDISDDSIGVRMDTTGEVVSLF